MEADIPQEYREGEKLGTSFVDLGQDFARKCHSRAVTRQGEHFDQESAIMDKKATGEV